LEIEGATGGLRIGGIRELDQSNALALQESVNAVLTDAVKTIVLDLSQTVFLDSQGLGALIALRNMMSRRKGVVRLLNPSRFVEQVLELTRLHRVLDIVKCKESLVL
jgi:anti-sigma B factor antagonist